MYLKNAKGYSLREKILNTKYNIVNATIYFTILKEALNIQKSKLILYTIVLTIISLII